MRIWAGWIGSWIVANLVGHINNWPFWAIQGLYLGLGSMVMSAQKDTN